MAPKVKLKPLSHGIRYAILSQNSTYPVIINDDLDENKTTML